ncbi:MAG: hypothetical protein RLZZ352_1982 [Pseudomonadota bacterium]
MVLLGPSAAGAAVATAGVVWVGGTATGTGAGAGTGTGAATAAVGAVVLTGVAGAGLAVEDSAAGNVDDGAGDDGAGAGVGTVCEAGGWALTDAGGFWGGCSGHSNTNKAASNSTAASHTAGGGLTEASCTTGGDVDDLKGAFKADSGTPSTGVLPIGICCKMGAGSILRCRQALAAKARVNTSPGSSSKRPASSACNLLTDTLSAAAKDSIGRPAVSLAWVSRLVEPAAVVVADEVLSEGECSFIESPTLIEIPFAGLRVATAQLLCQLLNHLMIAQLALQPDTQPQRLGVGQL